MGFSVGVIIAVGGLVAVILGMIAIDPGYLVEPAMEPVEEKPTVCTMEWDPICGVDGNTYGNLCMLDAEDVKLDYQGECVVEVIEELVVEEPVIEEPVIEEPIVAEPEVEEPVVDVPVSAASPIAPQTHKVSVPEGSGAPGCDETDECYLPYSLEINVNDTVLWSNDDTAAHTVTSGSASSGPDGIFDSSLFMAGALYEFTFEEAGTFDYFCIVHPWMIGEIIVNEVEEMIVENIIDAETVVGETVSEPVIEDSVVETVVAETVVEEITEDTIIEETVEELTELPMSAIVSVAVGSGVPGCEDTLECYLPYEVSIAAGGTVTWNNDDSAAHTVTGGKLPEGVSGVFDSSLFPTGKTYEFTFANEGSFDYFCMVHPWMTGIVNVG